MSTEDNVPVDDFPHYHISWADFDAVAGGGGGARVVHLLRRAERSRRLLLLRSIVEEAGKYPETVEPLMSPDDAWDLLARAEVADPTAVDLVLAHPYTVSW